MGNDKKLWFWYQVKEEQNGRKIEVWSPIKTIEEWMDKRSMVLVSHCLEPTLSRPRYRWAMLDYRAAERPSGWTLNDHLTACSCAVGKEAISEVRLQLGERKIRTASWSNGSDCARRRARAYRVLGNHSQSWFFARFLIKQKAKEKTALVLIKSAYFGHPLNMNKSQ